MTDPAIKHMAALAMVGRNLQEISEFGRILTDGERREIARLEQVSRDEQEKGAAHARAGGKMKANPHPGGSLEWWSWHDGYKLAKSAEAASQRREQRK